MALISGEWGRLVVDMIVLIVGLLKYKSGFSKYKIEKMVIF